MAQDVLIAGALFPDVPSVQLPDSQQQWHSFTDVSDTTAAASDVASGKYFYTAAGVKTAGTNSGGGGGGGSSRVVSGTFKGTDAQKGTAVEISLPYSGSGYPIALLIFPSEGSYCPNGDFYNLVKRYAIDVFSAVKTEIENAPSYTGVNSNDHMTVQYRSKGSATQATNYTGGAGMNEEVFSSSAPSANTTRVAKIKAKDKLSVFIANTSYGFADGIEYTYVVYYSS